MQNSIIYLFGLPATGKYTIATELLHHIDASLIDNHYINNPVFGLIENDGKTPLPDRIWTNTQKIREAIFDTLEHLAPADANYVLTNALTDNDPVDLDIYNNVQSLAKNRNAAFYPIRLLCSTDAMKERIACPKRKDRMKEISFERAQHIYDNNVVLRPNHPNLLELDVSELTPQQAADQILRHVS